ncbi:ABC transporter permease [Petroclostridium sp. X23]|uniref:ABC transporter permease n=1 Tax=Petroclostridium sp. X23 TaxID=3045146 RepID=UPI0024ADE879|nr:ABC transporter permease [Petroclostridium sp. X23]WHH58510.1 ABC transporter permease [Petroclostridium sp. X23]
MSNGKISETSGSINIKRLTMQPKKIINWLLEYNSVIIFIILAVVSSIISKSFFTERNIFNLLRQMSGLGIISMGMLMVILTSGIDLSVGSIVALSSVLSAYFALSMPLPAAIALTILMGVVFGVFSGYLVSVKKLAPFVVTLAAMTIARGFAFIISKGAPIMVEQEGLTSFGADYFLRVPYPVYLMFAIFIAILIILRYTVFGRMIIAIGSNEVAVRLSGIRVTYYKLMVYVFSGAFSAIAGIISTSRTGVGSPLVGDGFELDAIAAVVIGGASLNGGKGSALNTFLGVLILGMIGNIMNLMNVPAYPQQVIKGLIIIIAVILQKSESFKEA